MPVLTNVRHETYANERAKGLGSVKSAEKAGYKTPGVDCARLNKNPAIKARIEELRPAYDGMRMKALEAVTVPTRQEVLVDLVRCRDEAREKNDLQARMKANEMIGKELGMFVTRVDARIDSPLDGMGSDKLFALLAMLDAAKSGEIQFVAAQVVEHDDPLS